MTVPLWLCLIPKCILSPPPHGLCLYMWKKLVLNRSCRQKRREGKQVLGGGGQPGGGESLGEGGRESISFLNRVETFQYHFSLSLAS